MMRLLVIVLLALTLAACNPFSRPAPPTPQLLPPMTYEPAVPVVGGDDVAVDPVSGHCYRLAYLPATDRYPASIITLDGTDCPYGVGNHR